MHAVLGFAFLAVRAVLFGCFPCHISQFLAHWCFDYCPLFFYALVLRPYLSFNLILQTTLVHFVGRLGSVATEELGLLRLQFNQIVPLSCVFLVFPITSMFELVFNLLFHPLQLLIFSFFLFLELRVPLLLFGVLKFKTFFVH